MPIIGAVLCANQRRIVGVETHIMLDRVQMRFQPLDHRREHRIIHQHAVFGMVDNVDQLLVKQPNVERVDHAAHANHAVPGRQVAVMIHCKGCDPVPRVHPQCDQRLR